MVGGMPNFLAQFTQKNDFSVFKKWAFPRRSRHPDENVGIIGMSGSGVSLYIRHPDEKCRNCLMMPLHPLTRAVDSERSGTKKADESSPALSKIVCCTSYFATITRCVVTVPSFVTSTMYTPFSMFSVENPKFLLKTPRIIS